MSRCHRRRSDPALGWFLLAALVLGCFFTYPLASFTVLALVIAVTCAVAASKRKPKPAPVVRQIARPAPGADWCDHCAD